MKEEETLEGYLKKWNLSGPSPLARTTTSAVYTVTHAKSKAVLKILSPLGADDEKGAVQALRHFDGRGAVKLFRHDAGAHLMEYASDDDLVPLVKSGGDEKAAAIIGDVLNELHRPAAGDTGDLRPLRRWFRSLFEKADKKDSNPVYGHAAAVADRLLADENNSVVLHGDIHHENIRRNERGWLAFDPKGLVGERTFDAANALCNPGSMPELVQNKDRLLKNAVILAGKIDGDPARLLAFTFAYAALSASWSLEDGGDPTHALKMAALAERTMGNF